MSEVTDVIKRELAFNKFRPKKIPGVSYDTVVAEIANCLYTTYHERNAVPLGVLFCKNDISKKDGVRVVEMQQTHVDELRTLADGRRTFIVYMGSPEPKLAVLDNAVSDEIRLLELSRLADGIAMKRDDSGTVRIAQGEDLWLVENRHWERKHPLLEHMTLVRECLGSMPPHLRLPLRSLLRLAYYFLGSRNLGATLVWRVKEPAQPTMEGLSKAGLDLRNLSLSINDESGYSIIEHLLKYNDGAAIISPTGTIEYLGAHLIYGEEAVKHISPDKGTRHTSAKRFSFEHTETVVFVVSQDGPVSIYSDGYKVTEMAVNLGNQVSEELKGMVPEKSQDVDNYVRDIECGNCGRRIRIEEVVVLGWKEHETVDCPCCRSQNIYSSMCWSLSARPIKFYPCGEESQEGT